MAHRPDYVLGLDPGGRDTGLILRTGTGELLEHSLIHRGDAVTLAHYITSVLSSIADTVDPGTATVHQLGQRDPITFTTGGRPLHHDLPHGTLTIAVEDLVEPNPHLGIANLRGLMDTGVVLGGILGAYPTAVLVRPGHHGKQPLAAYPPELRGPRETDLRKVGTGILRHARSAYDIAGAAGLYADPPFGLLPRPAPSR